MTHTPGPWKLDKSCDGFRTVSNGSLTICTVGEADLFPAGEHDAHLIAAAPELLETLKEIVLSIQKGDVVDSTTIGDWYASAIQAITKAEGKG